MSKKKKTVKKAGPQKVKKKILILTASPVRDKYIDELIAKRLTAMGHEVHVHACLRQGRDKVLELQPDVVVVPPIRNPYSRDFVEMMKGWGLGIVTRHTEPSCDWQDFKKMTEQQKNDIIGRWQYTVDAELVWSDDEAQILSKRPWPFKVHAVGAIGLDIYFEEDFKTQLRNTEPFNKRYKLQDGRPTLLISSQWGFADSAPDLNIDETGEAMKDIQGRDRHLGMIRAVHKALKDEWNIVMTIHPGVIEDRYRKLAEELRIPLDSKSPMMAMLMNCDALIHAGSTAAISAHIIDIPAFQFGDVNIKDSRNWWGMPDSDISKVSPYYKTVEDLISDLQSRDLQAGSNADEKIIDSLEKGRYGKMDGKGADRAAEIISAVPGKFKFTWPKAHRDYDQALIFKDPARILEFGSCRICRQGFSMIKKDFLVRLAAIMKAPPENIPPINHNCPHCASKFFRK